ncbi:nucleotidyl transferase domain-containing protein [Ditylenchus destructor]|nr:nucleotidyl transferase domain-containing protein [Ditylenchus destructor]
MNYQAIVFAGGSGSRMTSLTDYMPKPLLPVANIPLFWYPLNMLSRSNVTDIKLVTNEKCYPEIRRLLTDGSLPPLPNLTVDVIAVKPENGEEIDDWGTADVLRHISSKIDRKRDIILVTGDIVTDLELTGMLDFHKNNGSHLTCLFSELILNGPVPGPKERLRKYRDFAALIPDTSQLLFLSEDEDFGDQQEFDAALFRRYSKIMLTSTYKDVHVYAMNSQLLDIIDWDTSFSSVKADFIPYLLKCQYSRKSEKLQNLLNRVAKADDENFRCFAYRCGAANATLVGHCNTINAYFEANRAVQRVLKNLSIEVSEKSREELKSSGIVVVDSTISATATTTGAKTAIKKSVVGNRCEIGANGKIESSLLMDGVKVKNGAVIKNSIVFPNVQIGEKSEVNMCIVSTSQTIADKVKFVNDVITAEREMKLDD